MKVIGIILWIVGILILLAVIVFLVFVGAQIAKEV